MLRNPWFVAALLAFALLAVVLVYRSATRSPYGDMTQRRIEEARQRVREGERQAPPARR